MFRRKPKTRGFRLNCRYVSDAASSVLTDEQIRDALRRHERGDWGSVDRQTRRENDHSLELGDGELMSIFETEDGTRFNVCSSRFHTFATIKLMNEF